MSGPYVQANDPFAGATSANVSSLTTSIQNHYVDDMVVARPWAMSLQSKPISGYSVANGSAYVAPSSLLWDM